MKIFFLLLATLLLASISFARSPISVNAVRVETPPVLDGVVTPEEYPAEPATRFTQFRPAEMIPALARTEVYVVYDDDAIYFGWICFEENTDALVSSAMVRDAFLNNDDSIDVVIDTNNDMETSYDFMTNPAGTKYDGIYARDGNAGGPEWDGVWDVATSIAEDRWYVEMKLPWENFTYSTDVTEMGLQLYRNRKPVYEDTTWAGDLSNLASIPYFGTLTGLEGLKPPKRFYFLPYGTVRGEQYPNEYGFDWNESEYEYDGGLDFEFNGGKPFTLNLTVNPDYAHIEADPEQIQLSQENIFLTEKRPFFTEANSAFSTPMRPLYTRSLGDIAGGAKATGTFGRFTYGVMDVQMEQDDPLFPEDNISAVRITSKLHEQSYVGGMVVTRYGRGFRNRFVDIDDYNIVGLLDTELALPKNFYLRLSAAKTQTERLPIMEQHYDAGKDYGYLTRLRYKPDFFSDINIGFNEYYENFQADVSFMQPFEINKRQAWSHGYKNIYFTDSILRDIQFNYYYTHEWRIDTGATTNNYFGPSTNVRFNKGFYINLFGNLGRDGRFYMYGIRDYGSQRTLNGGIDFGTDTASWGQVRGRFWHGEFLDTKYNDYTLDATFIPIPWLQLGLEVNVNDPLLDTADADYTEEADEMVGVANFKIITNITDDMYWRALVQGNTASDVYLGSALFAWTYLPGSTVYLAFEERRLDSEISGEVELIDRLVFLKGSYLLSL